ncbi:MAG: hypothetical protein ACI8PZ_002690 [Myxococcota bacterium]|jgi:hypothetical protein
MLLAAAMLAAAVDPAADGAVVQGTALRLRRGLRSAVRLTTCEADQNGAGASNRSR